MALNLDIDFGATFRYYSIQYYVDDTGPTYIILCTRVTVNLK